MELPDAALPASLAARVGPGNIRSLILEKEKELHDINEYRIRTLEALLRDKEAAASAAKQKLSKLQEDFKYNLKLLEGRDEELALYDANFASLKSVLRDRETELSELRAREAELQTELQRCKQRGDAQEAQHQQKLKDARAQMEGARWKFDDELRRQQDALETHRRSSEPQSFYTSLWSRMTRPRWLVLALVAVYTLGAFSISSRMASSIRLQQSQQMLTQRDSTKAEATSLFRKHGSRHNSIGTTSQETATDARIPHIIHQSWKDADNIPSYFHPWMKSWKAFHPTWSYVFWTDEDNLQLFENLYPEYLYVAKAVAKVSLADMARYALLHSVGGLYADADFECLKPFDELHRDYNLYLSSEPMAHTVLLENSESAALCNALMASAPGNSFWLHVLDNIKVKFDRGIGDPVELTGPRVVKETYLALASTSDSNESDVAVLPSEYFYPEIAYWNPEPFKKACRERNDSAATKACEWMVKFPNGEYTSNTHATHHWTCSWCRDAHLDEFSPVNEILTSPFMRPNITSAGVELVEFADHRTVAN
ncbi:hypothetical protein PHYBOEH_006139 [Phytophthora boehmeriae]|uniref:Uncharacterized protein n=1 Tax=Phytophthora boehmeriae TaxID=109152 RepID=A0A8T1WHH2_9STRA|nr:hypothetical protein PHYBOEH_006139 [Phytophthora boehmeriae]